MNEIEALEAFTYKPGDLVIAKVRDRITADQAHRIREQLRERLPDAGEIIVVDGVQVEIARPVTPTADEYDHDDARKIDARFRCAFVRAAHDGPCEPRDQAPADEEDCLKCPDSGRCCPEHGKHSSPHLGCILR